MRFLLPLSLLALACAGCSSAEKRAARAAEAAERENSRAVEERRLRVVDRGEMASQRGAEIYVADPTKTFDPRTASGIGSRKFDAKGARVKEFGYDQRFAAEEYRTRDFGGNKGATWQRDRFATSAARTSDYGGPNAGKAVDTKDAGSKEARESGRTAATRALPGATRTYLGPEAERVKKALDPGFQPQVRNELRELKTVEDIRELLNKNE